MGTMSTPAAPPAARVRLPYWDNAKWLAMALVVVGHVVQPIALDSNVALVPYLLIYAFHMPFFGVISGYFSTDTPTPRHYARIVTDLIVPYLVFEFIWSMIRSLLRGSFSFDPTTASWTLWFLLALAGFRLLLPMLARLRWPLAWAVLVAVVIGYWDGVDQTFSVMRMIGMLPFFVLGWQLKRWGVMDGWMTASRTLGLRAAAVGVFAAAATAIVVWPTVWRESKIRHWFFLDRPFADIADGEDWYDGGIRLLVMLTTTVLIAAALLLVPRGRTWFSDWGAATMTIYLLHTFVLYWARESGWLRSLAPEWWSTPLAIIAGLAITIVLSLPLVRKLTDWIVAPKADWLLRT